MLLKARPLYDNQADSTYFVPSDAWDPLLRAVERDLNVLLQGEKGVGKTSLLHQLQYGLRFRGRKVAFVDGTGVRDVRELVGRVCAALSKPPRETLADELQSIGEAPRHLILVDGPSSPEAVYDLFGRMRDVLWQQDHNWVVALDPRDHAAVVRPPADAFFDIVVKLERWSADRLVALLSRRFDEEEKLPGELIAAVAAKADGSPREAIRALSRGIVNETDPADLLEARGQLLERAGELGRASAMVMAELLERGAVSPSDAELQDTLGVTRTRLSQLLGLLAEHELVVSEEGRAEGPGRPRVLYRPRVSE